MYPFTPKLVIVDDEPLGRVRLLDLLHDLENVFLHDIVATLSSGEALLTWLENNTADIVFLDVAMSGLNGIEIASTLQRMRQIKNNIPQVILVTAYSDYAISAFEVSAADYILKPATAERLEKACNRAMEIARATYQELETSRIVIKEKNNVTFIQPNEIIYCQSDMKYTTIVTDTKDWISDYTLNELEEILYPQALRIHRSIIVMKSRVAELIRINTTLESGWMLKLINLHTTLPVARRQVPIVKAHFSKKK